MTSVPHPRQTPPPLLDPAEALVSVGGDESLLRDLFTLFAADLRAAAAELAATDRADWAATVHRLKGSAAAVGALRLHDWCCAWPEPGPMLDDGPALVAATEHAVVEAAARYQGGAADRARPPAPGRPRVLVVEDVAAHSYVLATALGPDYEVSVAPDAESALTLLAAGPAPDLILLDVGMPGMDGFEFFRRLRADGRLPDLPVIFVTGHQDSADEERGLSLGAADYVHKPVQPALLRARVRNHLRLRHQAELLARAAVTDPLTGAANRRQALLTVRREWARGRRGGRPLSVVMVDIDHFKAFNDAAGHLAGDECLRTVAGALARSLRRPADTVARWGGEEFLAILPETDAVGAEAVGDGLVAAVSDLAILHPARSGSLTISAGCATTTDYAGEWPALVASADRALYRAKESGRARCVGESAKFEPHRNGP